jgi:hypothetical protein
VQRSLQKTRPEAAPHWLPVELWAAHLGPIHSQDPIGDLTSNMDTPFRARQGAMLQGIHCQLVQRENQCLSLPWRNHRGAGAFPNIEADPSGASLRGKPGCKRRTHHIGKRRELPSMLS